MTAEQSDLFGRYLDAQMRLVAAGYTLTIAGDMVQGYTIIALRPDGPPRTARGPVLSWPTIRLADRLAPGAK